MACIHFKFKNSLDYDSVTFDGLHISLGDLKKAIMQRKKLKDTDVDLHIVNAITKKAYQDLEEMIPKNTSVIVARIPLANAPKSSGPKTLDAYPRDEPKTSRAPPPLPEAKPEGLSQVVDLASASGSEEDKIAAAIYQSTRDFDPSNYLNKNKYPTGTPSSSYICFKCGKPGHYIHNCPNKIQQPLDDVSSPDGGNSPSSKDVSRPKRSTGIPSSFLTYVPDRNVPGALLTARGSYAVPTIDMDAMKRGKKELPPFLPQPKSLVPEEKAPPVPQELVCSLCKDLFTEAVLIPCCGTSYCDECIREALLDTEDHMCPNCHEVDVSPDKLISNQNLRKAVTNFLNETGYTSAHAGKKMKAYMAEEAKTKTTPQSSKPGIKITLLNNKSSSNEAPPPTPDKLTGSHPDDQPTPVKDERELSWSKASRDEKEDTDRNSETPPTPTLESLVPSTTLPATRGIAVSIPNYPPPTLVNATGTVVPPPLVTGAALPPSLPVVPGLPFNTRIPPPGFPPPGPPILPGAFPPRIPPPFPPAPPQPLSKEEFYRQQKRLQRLEEEKHLEAMDEFTRKLMSNRRYSRSRSRSTPRNRSRSISPHIRSRSRTPRKWSKSRSRSRSRSRTPVKPRYRSISPRRRSRTRSRSRSRSPKRIFRSRTRSRTRSPFRRSRSRSRSPRRFKSRSPRSPFRYRSRSRSPYFRRSRSYSPGFGRRSPFNRRSRSRSRTPPRFRRSPDSYQSRDYFYGGYSPPPGGYRGGRGPQPSGPYRDGRRGGRFSPPPPMFGNSGPGFPPGMTDNYGMRGFNQYTVNPFYNDFYGVPSSMPHGQAMGFVAVSPRRDFQSGMRGRHSLSRSPSPEGRNRNDKKLPRSPVRKEGRKDRKEEKGKTKKENNVGKGGSKDDNKEKKKTVKKGDKSKGKTKDNKKTKVKTSSKDKKADEAKNEKNKKDGDVEAVSHKTKTEAVEGKSSNQEEKLVPPVPAVTSKETVAAKKTPVKREKAKVIRLIKKVPRKNNPPPASTADVGKSSQEGKDTEKPTDKTSEVKNKDVDSKAPATTKDKNDMFSDDFSPTLEEKVPASEQVKLTTGEPVKQSSVKGEEELEKTREKRSLSPKLAQEKQSGTNRSRSNSLDRVKSKKKEAEENERKGKKQRSKSPSQGRSRSKQDDKSDKKHARSKSPSTRKEKKKEPKEMKSKESSDISQRLHSPKRKDAEQSKADIISGKGTSQDEKLTSSQSRDYERVSKERKQKESSRSTPDERLDNSGNSTPQYFNEDVEMESADEEKVGKKEVGGNKEKMKSKVNVLSESTKDKKSKVDLRTILKEKKAKKETPPLKKSPVASTVHSRLGRRDSDKIEISSGKLKRLKHKDLDAQDSDDESPAKRARTDDDELDLTGKHTDELLLSPPELSKWEREEHRASSPETKHRTSTVSRKSQGSKLPRSVIENAEKNLLQKSQGGSIVASNWTSSKSRRVFVSDDENSSDSSSEAEERNSHKKIPLKNRIARDHRKVLQRQSSMQIVISQAEKHRISESESKDFNDNRSSSKHNQRQNTRSRSPSHHGSHKEMDKDKKLKHRERQRSKEKDHKSNHTEDRKGKRTEKNSDSVRSWHSSDREGSRSKEDYRKDRKSKHKSQESQRQRSDGEDSENDTKEDQRRKERKINKKECRDDDKSSRHSEDRQRKHEKRESSKSRHGNDSDFSEDRKKKDKLVKVKRQGSLEDQDSQDSRNLDHNIDKDRQRRSDSREVSKDRKNDRGKRRTSESKEKEDKKSKQKRSKYSENEEIGKTIAKNKSERGKQSENKEMEIENIGKSDKRETKHLEKEAIEKELTIKNKGKIKNSTEEEESQKETHKRSNKMDPVSSEKETLKDKMSKEEVKKDRKEKSEGKKEKKESMLLEDRDFVEKEKKKFMAELKKKSESVKDDVKSVKDDVKDSVFQDDKSLNKDTEIDQSKSSSQSESSKIEQEEKTNVEKDAEAINKSQTLERNFSITDEAAFEPDYIDESSNEEEAPMEAKEQERKPSRSDESQHESEAIDDRGDSPETRTKEIPPANIKSSSSQDGEETAEEGEVGEEEGDEESEEEDSEDEGKSKKKKKKDKHKKSKHKKNKKHKHKHKKKKHKKVKEDDE